MNDTKIFKQVEREMLIPFARNIRCELSFLKYLWHFHGNKQKELPSELQMYPI